MGGRSEGYQLSTRGRISRVATVASVVVLLSVFSTAHADRSVRRDANDVRSFLDIASVKHQHDRMEDGRRRIRHTITMHEAWSSRWLFRSGCGHLSIYIDDPGRYISFYRRQGELRARLGRRRLPVWRPDRRSIAVRIPPRLIAGDDATYRWRAASLATREPSCEGGSTGWVDYSPNDRWIRHDL